MVIKVKMTTIVGILTFMSMIHFVLGWIERGKGFYNLRPCLGQQKYSIPKMKIVIRQDFLKTKALCFCQTSRKKSVSDRYVVGAQKNSLG